MSAIKSYDYKSKAKAILSEMNRSVNPLYEVIIASALLEAYSEGTNAGITALAKKLTEGK